MSRCLQGARSERAFSEERFSLFLFVAVPFSPSCLVAQTNRDESARARGIAMAARGARGMQASTCTFALSARSAVGTGVAGLHSARRAPPARAAFFTRAAIAEVRPSRRRLAPSLAREASRQRGGHACRWAHLPGLSTRGRGPGAASRRVRLRGLTCCPAAPLATAAGGGGGRGAGGVRDAALAKGLRPEGAALPRGLLRARCALQPPPRA